jgi:hypothetical protein
MPKQPQLKYIVSSDLSMAKCRPLHGPVRSNLYTGTLRNKKGCYGLLNLVNKETPQDQIVAALANSEYIRLSIQTDAARKKLTALDQAIVKISEGHQKLYDSRNEPGSGALRIILASMSKELQSLWNELKTVKG